MRRRIAQLIVLLGLALVAPSLAAEQNDLARTGTDLREHPATEVELDGYFRTRGTAYHNLDLDRGPTPSGQYLFPLPLTNPREQWLTHSDMRLRTDLALYSLDGTVAVKLRVDVLDNVALGAHPDAPPLTTDSQLSPADAVEVERAYGEALTPLGVLAVGRMGAHWGLGMLAHGGDCLDCDSGNTADRIAFVTPLLGHLWALAYDINYVGPTGLRSDQVRTLDLDPNDDVRTVTAAVLRWRDDESIAARLRAGVSTFDYGATVSYRWQSNDVPAWWLPATEQPAIGPRQVVRRDFDATIVDGWARFVHPWIRLEAEAAYLHSTIAQTSIVPGVETLEPLTADQWGAAFESSLGPVTGSLFGGIDAGIASGDSAPGFGAFTSAFATPAQPGDLEGAQYAPPADNALNNFRFHPDYHVDRILFREIIGTVTDAAYVRPHVEWTMAEAGPSKLDLLVAAVASWAVNAESTPGHDHALGVELDPSLVYTNEDGFQFAAEYAAFFPGAGLDNPQAGLSASTAQLFRLRATYGF